MGLGRYLIDWRVMELISKSRLYWNPLRKQTKLHHQQILWEKGLITRWLS